MQELTSYIMSLSSGVSALLFKIRTRGLKFGMLLAWRILLIVINIPLYIIALPCVIIIRLIRPFLLIRIGGLISSRIGHFAANTELYFCEIEAGLNKPSSRYIDLFYTRTRPISNRYLYKMWKRQLTIWPSWFMSPIHKLNQWIPGGKIHDVGNNTQNDRDVHNLYARFTHHLHFTEDEVQAGKEGLRKMGISDNDKFVCMLVRDSAYLNTHQPGNWSYHDYRDSNVKNYVKAAELLAERGYFVIRMGASVNQEMITGNPKIIDYACNGMRSEFMDIYLGAHCEFSISTSSGWDAIPVIFRRPILYVNMVPFGYMHISCEHSIGLAKRHFRISDNSELTLREIFSSPIAFSIHSSDYEANGIKLIENSPEELANAVIEMDDRLKGTWISTPGDDALQKKFWDIFPVHAVDSEKKKPLHGDIRLKYSAHFLRNNIHWLK